MTDTRKEIDLEDGVYATIICRVCHQEFLTDYPEINICVHCGDDQDTATVAVKAVAL